jgi:hypothetical protein
VNAKQPTPTLTLIHAAKKAQPSRYHYPASLLKQAYFCRLGNGSWTPPPLSLHMLTHPEFVSPLGALLDQLEADGHDVAGARIEWRAFRELAGQMEGALSALAIQAKAITDSRPACAAAMYESREP